jgi:dinuclear metal center YbgI/SA1388 family protein
LVVDVAWISGWMEQLAPQHLAEEWDNVGLQVGSHATCVGRIMTCLSLSKAVLQQAIAAEVQLIVAHHPLIFQPLKSLTEHSPIANLVTQLIKHDIALFAAHTNLDAASKGVGLWLDEMFDLRQSAPLALCPRDTYVKLVTFVPTSHLEAVRDAITAAGAGHIGRYSACTFSTTGTGSFLPEQGTQPFIGEVGELTQVAEIRLETVVREDMLSHVLEQMRQAHPYEEVAYDVYPMLISPRCGYGRIGNLAETQSFTDFLTFVKNQLQVSQLRIAGPMPRSVRRVAILNGSGASFIENAARAGAEVYVTGDVRYHDAEKAEALGLCVVDAGHFGTEKFIPGRVAHYLREVIATGNLRCDVLEADETELIHLL